MNAELKQQWVDALRSGKYRQIRGEFGKGYQACALGVLLNVVNPERVRLSILNNSLSQASSDAHLMEEMIPVQRVRGVVTVMNDMGIVNHPTRIRRWLRTTDVPLSFNAIAEWIEENIAVDANQDVPLPPEKSAQLPGLTPSQPGPNHADIHLLTV